MNHFVLIVPFETHAENLRQSIDHYVLNEDYEKAAKIRDELNDFEGAGKDKEFQINATSAVNLDKFNN